MFVIRFAKKKYRMNFDHLVNKVLHADDAELAQGALNQIVGGDGGTVAIDLRNKSQIWIPLNFERYCACKCLYQTFSGHYANVKVGNVGYRKIQSRTAYSPATQNKMLANFCPIEIC